MAINPLLLDFPDQFETPRLLIRAPRLDDGPVVNEAVQESIAELRAWMPWAQSDPVPVDDQIAFVRRGVAGWATRSNLPMLLFRKADGLFLGGSGLHRINWAVPSFEIGYWLRTSQTRQGYMTEAVKGITEFALLELGAERIEIRCDARNQRSAAVARRAGYALEATFRNHDRGIDGSLRDTLVFALYPPD